jgi:epsilon-lactone hydrolase
MSHEGVDLIRSFLAESRVQAGTIKEQRAAMEAMASSAELPEGVSIRSSTLGGCQAEWISPDDAPDDAGHGAVVLYLHGGGYCVGSLDTHRALAARIALATGCSVVTIAYRLAPEHPFPSAVDDACAAYRELLAGGRRPERIAIAGDSAGGGLTVATVLALRSERIPLPAAMACLSPWVDLTQSAPTYQTLADVDPMVSKEGLDVMAGAYLGGTDAHDELASPLFADNLGDLPPALIEVGEHEVLLDDSLRLAERIRADGGSVDLTEWPELIHVFQAFPGPLVPEADQSIAAIGSFLAGHLRTAD